MDSTAKRSAKESMILDVALGILRETGDAGLTMRKIAEGAGMRLSNVQYYFKSRDDVLKAMVARYFDECTREIRQLTQDNPAPSRRDRAHLLILTALRHGDTLSDMCRIFRELWAISSRNAAVREDMTGYYRNFAALIVDFILDGSGGPAAQDRLASLLLPFFEGYSVTASATPLSTESIADMLTDIAIAVIDPPASSGPGSEHGHAPGTGPEGG